MKTIILTLFLCAGFAFGQVTGQSASDTLGSASRLSISHVLGGEHVPLIFTGSHTVSKTSSRFPYTRWMQVGSIPGKDVDKISNDLVQAFNPEYFRVGVKLACTLEGDSAAMSFGKFQYALSASDTVTSVTLAVGEGDTTDVGETITGTESGASAVVTAVTSGTGGADSIIVANYLPGPVFTTSDTVGGALYAGTGSKISSVANYFGTIGENADSTHWFCYSGAVSMEAYPEYMAEPVYDTTMYWWFPMRVLMGGYLRLYFETDAIDTSTIDWTLKCEH